MSMIAEAFKLALESHLRVFPVHTPKVGGGCSCSNEKCPPGQWGKHPRIMQWQYAATCERETLEEWWGKWPNANIGIPTGNGLLVVDIDDPNCEAAQALLPLLPATLAVRTGRTSGMHRWYTTKRANELTVHQLNGVDIRAKTGYVVAPPSLHKSGNRYEWYEDASANAVELPDDVMDLLISMCKKKKAALQKAVVSGDKIPEGSRHDFMRKAIHDRAILGGMPREELEAVVDKYLMERVDGEMDETEVERLIDGAYGKRDGLILNINELSEAGLSGKFIEYFSGKACYHESEGWLWYNGSTWEKLYGPENIVQEVRHAAYAATRRTLHEDSPGGGKLAKFFEASGSYNFSTNVLKFAASKVRVAQKDFQVPKDTLPFKNGLFDLVTGEFRSFRPADHVIETLNVSYDAKATCPNWESTVDRITGSNAEAMRYIQQVFGYLLSTRTMRAIWYFVGVKNTGKSTLVGTLAWALGNTFAGTAQLGLIHKTRGLNDDEDMARMCVALHGRRFVFMDETKDDQVVDTAKFKRIASTGSVLVGRRLRQDAFNFENHCKVVVMSNLPPSIDPQDMAAWDRVVYVPFLVPIPDDERIETFNDDLRAEASGILNWCIKGFTDYLENGWQRPEIVKQRVEQWQKDESPIFRFVEDNCTFDAETGATPATIYDKYQEWHKEESLGEQGKFKGSGDFMKVLYQLYAELKPGKSNGKRVIKGISLRDM